MDRNFTRTPSPASLSCVASREAANEMPAQVIRSAMRILNAHVPPADLADVVSRMIASDAIALERAPA